MNAYAQLKNKTALITGSTSGIGLGIAKGFAAAGINVMLNGLDKPEDVEKLRIEVEALGAKALYNPADMTKPEQIAALVEDTVQRLGSIDIIVNNAGIQNISPVEDFPLAKWDAIIATNLSSSFHAVRAAIPHMKKKGWGRIINIASAHGLVASPFKSAYVAAKHGVVGFTKSIALETAQNGITSNAICPGYVLTPLVQNQIADTAKARGISEDEVVKNVMLAAQWTKKFVTVEQLAGVALFLCTSAADNITGSAIPVDGGWTAA